MPSSRSLPGLSGWFSQSPNQVRAEWGMRGAREAAERGDIVIIVDVLSFSSTVASAVRVGAVVHPHSKDSFAQSYADSVHAELIAGRMEAAGSGAPSLSPVSFGPRHRGRRYVLCSLNGAACSQAGMRASALFAGCLLNASTVAQAADRLQAETGAAITVVPCGEQWAHPRGGENVLRPAIEDYLGAGAIIRRLTGVKSAEAEMCEAAFAAAEPRLGDLIWASGSGRELRERGYADDVRHCVRLDAFDSAPLLGADGFRPA